MDNLHYTLWAIWGELPFLLKLYFLILILICFYTLFSSFVILVRLRSLARQCQVGDVSSLERSIAVLQSRSNNASQLVGVTFYFFGFTFFLALPLAFTQGGGRFSGLTLIFYNFSVFFTFAANVFFIFLILRSVQWIVSCRIHAFARRLTTKNIA
jgi:hypothetical protein